jgi:ssDNA-binding Zn-finger/Zn-ribbon topoisomerase 1
MLEVLFTLKMKLKATRKKLVGQIRLKGRFVNCMNLVHIKCPKCEKQVKKKILKLTNGRCNNCGYMLAGSLSRFAFNNSLNEKSKEK